MLGWASSRPPDELMKAAQVVLGTSVGCAFVRATAGDMLRTVRDTLVYFLILMALAIGFALVSQAITGLPLLSALLAFAPGGQAEMNIIAIIVAANVPFIALHHVVRLALIMAVAPPLFRALNRL